MECNCCLFLGMEVCEFESEGSSMSGVLVGGLFDVLGEFFGVFFAVMVELSSLTFDLRFTVGDDFDFETFKVFALIFSSSPA